MPKKPNLLYIFADQLRRSSCGYTGYERAQTPNIDAFAGRSMDFTQAVSGHPVCAPYRASLFTGKYTTSTGMVINEIRLNPNQRCIGHVLGEAGYETAYIGKWHLYANELGHHFETRNSFTPPGPHRLGFDDTWASFGFHHEYYAPSAYYHTDSPEKIFVEGYEPDAQTSLAIGHLERLAGQEQPFAMFLSLGTPHDPWDETNVPGDALARFDPAAYDYPPNYLPENDPYGDNWSRLREGERPQLPQWMRVYDAMVYNLDQNIGRLMEAVGRLGLDENTIIVFTSDHGECFGAHGRRAKNIFYEEAVRVPFLLRAPGGVQARATCDACLNTVDILPTLLDLMDLPIPQGVQGMSLAGLVNGTNNTEPPFAFMQCTGAVAAFVDGVEWRALRDKRYTYGRFRVDGKELLFDNLADPYQMRNLVDSPEHQERLVRMRADLAAKMAELNDNFEACTTYRDQWTENRVILRSATDDWTRG